jgi:CRISPR-associated protein Cas1
MRALLNTLFVTSEDTYLTLEGENVVVGRERETLARFPLHTLEGIFAFNYAGASPALMGACVKRQINLCFCTPNGRFLARTVGEFNGNVLLRRMQYRLADSPHTSCQIAKNMVYGKVYNSRWSIERTIRDHSLRVNSETLINASEMLKRALSSIPQAETLESLRGLEGEAASVYFSAMDEMILNNKSDFFFRSRNRRPPLDRVNAMLSFSYALLTNDCASALESAGLDSFVGFLHRDRPGRSSLALDLMEELRPCCADRFVISLINNRIIKPDNFEKRENGAVIMSDSGRKTIIQAWQERKREKITHPYLKEKIPWGLVPYVQSLLLARFLRDDLDGYPPFLWK